MRMLVLLVLAYVVARLGLMAVDYTVAVIVVKALVWSVHRCASVNLSVFIIILQ